jgi:hypothetical protein
VIKGREIVNHQTAEPIKIVSYNLRFGGEFDNFGKILFSKLLFAIS